MGRPPTVRWSRWISSYRSDDVLYKNLLIPVTDGVVHAIAEYRHDYYNGWYDPPVRRFVQLAAETGAELPVPAPLELPAEWPPSTGYAGSDEWPDRTTVDVDDVRYTALRNQVTAMAHPDGTPLWTVTLDFAEPPYRPAPNFRPGTGGSGRPHVCWLAPAPSGLYLLTSHGTVARLL